MAFLIVKAAPLPDFIEGTIRDRIIGKYDIVHVVETLDNVGRAEFYPDFFIFEVEGKTAAELAYLLQGRISPIQSASGTAIIQNERIYFYDFDSKLGASRIQEIIESSDWDVPKISLSDIGSKT